MHKFIVWLLLLIFPASFLSFLGIIPSTAEIALFSNPTTGYEWVLYSDEIDGDSCDDCDCDEVIRLTNTITSLKDNGLLGGSKLTTVYVYEALRPGDVTLTFRLVRPTVPSDVAEVRAFRFHVSRRMMLSAVEVVPSPKIDLKGADPDLGKVWLLDSAVPEDTVKVFDYVYTPSLNPEKDGTYSFVLVGLAEGTCILEFNYVSASGAGDAEATAAFEVSVDSELNITVAEYDPVV